MKSVISFLILGLVTVHVASAQIAFTSTTYQDQFASANDDIVLEQSPDKNTIATFPGGTKALNQHLANNFKYSDADRENGFEGTIIVCCTIDATGKATDCEVFESVHPIVDKKALKAVSQMPEWTPATSAGVAVASKVFIPFKLRLR